MELSPLNGNLVSVTAKDKVADVDGLFHPINAGKVGIFRTVCPVLEKTCRLLPAIIMDISVGQLERRKLVR